MFFVAIFGRSYKYKSMLEEKIKKQAADNLEKLAKIKSWQGKLNKLQERAEPLSEAAFCMKYDISKSRFNRIKKLVEPSIPSNKFFKVVDEAFKSEGV